jgi:hypothetical protein
MDPNTRIFLNSLIGALISAVVGVFVTLLWRAKTRAEVEKAAIAADHLATVKRLTETETRLAVVTAQMVPLNAAMLQAIVKQMTHIHTPELDALMTRVGPHAVPPPLTPDEEVLMYRLVAERRVAVDAEIDEDERDAAAIFPVILKRANAEAIALADLAAQSPARTVRLISLTATIENQYGERKAILLSPPAVPLNLTADGHELHDKIDLLSTKIDRLDTKNDDHDKWERARAEQRRASDR